MAQLLQLRLNLLLAFAAVEVLCCLCLPAYSQVNVYDQFQLEAPDVAQENHAEAGNPGDLPLVEPTSIITYPGDTVIGDIALGPNGDSIVNLIGVRGVNLWSLLVYCWPEVVCLLLLGIGASIYMRKRKIKPWTGIGEPHCRECDYRLTGCDSHRCPECGAHVSGKKKVCGKNMRVRPIMWFASSILLIIFIQVGCRRFPWMFPRIGTVSNALCWSSPALYDWAARMDYKWLSAHSTCITHLVEVSPDTGQVFRTFWKAHTPKVNGPLDLIEVLSIGPDSRYAYYRTFNSVTRIDLYTCGVLEVHDEVSWGTVERWGGRNCFLSAIAPTSNPATVYCMDTLGSVSALDMNTKQLRRLPRDERGSPIPFGRHRVFAFADDKYLLEYLFPYQQSKAASPTIQYRNATSTTHPSPIQPSIGQWYSSPVVPNSQLLLCASTSLGATEVWDLAAMHRVSCIRTPPVIDSCMTMSSDALYLIVRERQEQVSPLLIYDLFNEQYVVRLKTNTYMVYDAIMDASSEWIVVSVYTANGQALLVYDVASVLSDPGVPNDLSSQN
ncbi:MAG: hypothetical protein D8M59_16020 [Planctomycetes bacterium]|nr:hypothetical protein [Planctomycetota bacterium]NOG52753.1 hypothetical protein [Planctomycetota bacterium]